jgi:TRAP-type C4-dicarboxylate transport system permease small subunit
MKEKTMNRFDKFGLFIIGLVAGFSAGVAISSWHWFPEEIWWHNPLAVIPQTALSYFSLLAPFVAAFIFLIVRRIISKSKI